MSTVETEQLMADSIIGFRKRFAIREFTAVVN